MEKRDRWRELCRHHGIDPREVQLIHERYDAYRGFTEQAAGSSITLAQWYRFYQLEKSSEGLQAGAPVQGCSAGGDAVNDACLRCPDEFFEVLKAYEAREKSL